MTSSKTSIAIQIITALVGVILFISPLIDASWDVWSKTIIHLLTIITCILYVITRLYIASVAVTKNYQQQHLMLTLKQVQGLFQHLKSPILISSFSTYSLTFFVLWLFVSYIFSKIKFHTEFELHNFINYFLIFMLIRYLIENSKEEKVKYAIKDFVILKYAVGSTLVLVVFAIYQFLTQVPVQSFMLNPNIFAGYLVMIIPVLFYIANWKFSHIYHSILTLLLTILAILCLIFTKSLWAICSLLCAIAIVKLGLRRGLLAFMILLLVAFLIKSADPELINRYFWWESTLRIIKDNPLFGTGLGTYEYIYPKYKISALSTMFAHNYYLQLSSEIGIIGLVIFFVFILQAVLKIQNPYYKISILGILFQNIFDYSLYIPANVILFCAVLSLGAKNELRTTQNTEDSQRTNINRQKYRISVSSVVILLLLMIYTNSVLRVYFSTINYNRGKNCLEVNDIDGALKYFNKAKCIKPNMWLVYPEMAKIALIEYRKSNYKSYLFEFEIYLQETKKYNRCYQY